MATRSRFATAISGLLNARYLAMRRRFTLLELLVVVAIISILAAILLPALTKARYNVQLTACAGNVRQIALAGLLYAGDNTDDLPPSIAWNGSWSWPTVLNYQPGTATGARGGRRLYTFMGDYLPDVRIYTCPLNAPQPANLQTQYEAAPNSGSSWLWQSYAIWWGFDGLVSTFRGPNQLGDDSTSGVIAGDLFMFRTTNARWWGPHSKPGLATTSSNTVSANTNTWMYPHTGRPNDVRLNVGYTDGRVQTIYSGDTTKYNLASSGSLGFYLPNDLK